MNIINKIDIFIKLTNFAEDLQEILNLNDARLHATIDAFDAFTLCSPVIKTFLARHFVTAIGIRYRGNAHQTDHTFRPFIFIFINNFV